MALTDAGCPSAEYAVYSFGSMIPDDSNPVPHNRIDRFLTLGPFVLETDGAFESEHFYGRDKILLEDYLLPDGGERHILPALGDRVSNHYYGDAYLVWKRAYSRAGEIRFVRPEDACDPALFATEQRNAVFYAGFYVDCDRPEKAILSYVNSGSALFLNGERIDFRPYGRVKGLKGLGYQCPVRLKKGRNCFLFKIRPGYIADSMDMSIASCLLFPVVAECEGLWITSPTKTLAYTGSEAHPRMVFPFFAYADRDPACASISCDGKSIPLPELTRGSCALLRAEITAKSEPTIRACRMKISNHGKEAVCRQYFDTVPFDGFTGNEHIFSEFHFDTTYHQEQRTYALGALHITKCIVENLEQNPDFKAILSEIDYLHPYYTLYPQHRETIREAFRSGRAESDCFYNQPNDLTSGGEAFVRNLIYGQLYHRDVLGRISRIYVPEDVYGHFSQISQICKKGGCGMVKWFKPMLGVDQMFRHVSPDGTALLHDKGIRRDDALRLGMDACSDSSQALSYVEAFPRCGDTSWMKNTLSHASFSVFSELAEEHLRRDAENRSDGCDRIDTTSRDITQHHSGTVLTRTDFKQANRLCENLLVSAEKFASVAALYGAEYPEKALDKAWRQLLCGQHHDSITGTNNEVSFFDLMAEYRECAETAADILKRAAVYLTSGIPDAEQSLAVFNPVPSDVSGICRADLPALPEGRHAVLTDPNGNEHPVFSDHGTPSFLAGKIPATGYALYRIRETDEDPDPVRRDSGNTIENRRFRLTVDPSKGGGIRSLYDKIERKEFIDRDAPSLGNAIYALREEHGRAETQHEIYTTGQKLCSDDCGAEITREICASYQRLTVTGALGTLACVTREITLYAGSDTVDFRTVVEDYQGCDDLFTAAFPVDIKGGAVIFDDRFAPHVSTRSKGYMSFRTHQYASFSGCRILPSNRFFGVGPSVTARLGSEDSIQFGMTAIIRKDTPVLRGAADRILTALTKKGIPVTPYPDTEQHGGSKIIHYNEDVYETDTRVVVALAGDPDAYTEQLLATLSDARRRMLDERLAKRGFAYAFLYDSDNLYQKRIDVILLLAADEARLSAAVSGIEEELAEGHVLTLRDCVRCARPGEADPYGVALLNNGCIAASVEGKNTLNLMLFHTAAFYGNAGKVSGGEEFVPERKTHVFTYALYPHRDSYREADVYRVADAYNETLFSVRPTGAEHASSLPVKQSFLRVSPGFEVTAFKAGGYPYASLRSGDTPISERGFTLRGFETTGTGHDVTITTAFAIRDAFSSDLLDEDRIPLPAAQKKLTFRCGTHSVETVGFFPRNAASPAGIRIGTGTDLTEPTYVRSWEHDMGAVATGFLRFAATLDKRPMPVDDRTTTVHLNTVNNATDETVRACVKLRCSKGLHADRSSVTVTLAPGESRVIPITVTRDRCDRKGQLTALYTFDGQQFTDVYEFGYFNPEVSLRLAGKRAICTVKNPTDQTLCASLLFITPIETWDIAGMNPVAYGNAGPLARAIELGPHAAETFEFTIDNREEDGFKAYYAAVKLCCNGRIHFAFADRHGPNHALRANEFVRVIREDNGSIEKLLNM